MKFPFFHNLPYQTCDSLWTQLRAFFNEFLKNKYIVYAVFRVEEYPEKVCVVSAILTKASPSNLNTSIFKCKFVKFYYGKKYRACLVKR